MVPTDEEILAMDRVLPEIAAKYLDVDTQYIRFGLQQRSLPFGTAVQNPSGKYSYLVSPGLLVAYKRGTLKIEVHNFIKE